MLLSSINSLFSQDTKNRLFITSGFQSTGITIDEANDDNSSLTTKVSTNPRFELSYEHYLNKKSGIALNLGYSNLTKYFIFKLDQASQDSLSSKDLNWNEDIRIPNDQQFINFQINYVFQLLNKGKNILSVITGSYFRYVFLDETYNAENMFFENEEDFSQAIGPKSFESFANYKKLTIQPSLTFRYERKTKFSNSYGIFITFNLPLLKSYEGNLFILPENEDLKSSFKYYSRGGFLGVSLFYGIGF